MGEFTMKLSILFSGIFADLSFENWSESYNKSFSSVQARREAFYKWSENAEVVKNHSSKSTFSIYLNQFAAESLPEKLPPSDSLECPLAQFKVDKVPDSIDYRKIGCVNSVKTASTICSTDTEVFAAIDAIATVICKEDGALYELSRQNLVDCSMKKCLLPECFLAEAAALGGVNTEKCYPSLLCFSGQCNYDPYCNYAPIQGCYSLPKIGQNQVADEKYLTFIIGEYGPVTALIQATSKFLLYTGGIFYDDSCAENGYGKLNHAVVIVGYGSENGQDYYIVKNSWGSSWGEDGYIRMARNMKNNCGIASQNSFPYYTL